MEQKNPGSMKCLCAHDMAATEATRKRLTLETKICGVLRWLPQQRNGRNCHRWSQRVGFPRGREQRSTNVGKRKAMLDDLINRSCSLTLLGGFSLMMGKVTILIDGLRRVFPSHAQEGEPITKPRNYWKRNPAAARILMLLQFVVPSGYTSPIWTVWVSWEHMAFIS